MHKQITQEQTKELFEFCHKHFVYHYDLQIELVDHLASSIEEQWQDNAEISFNEALIKSFGKFGITGFSKIKVQKEKELGRKYNIILRKYLLEFYTFPKLLLTLALTMLLFTLFRVVENNFLVIIPMLVLLTIGLTYYYVVLFTKLFKIKTKPGKSFLLLKRLRDVQLVGIAAVQLPIHVYNISNFQMEETPLIMFLISLVTVSIIIALYGNFFYIPQKIKQHFMEQFAEFIV